MNQCQSQICFGRGHGVNLEGYDKDIASQATEALDEVNAVRAKKGLKPYERDECLTEGAKYVAVERAKALCEGHTKNDFRGLPEGCDASVGGCAAWTPDWGWGSCATYEKWKYAGAAWMLGSDGRRFMQLFCRN